MTLYLDELAVPGEFVCDLTHPRHSRVNELDGVVAVLVRHHRQLGGHSQRGVLNE